MAFPRLPAELVTRVCALLLVFTAGCATPVVTRKPVMDLPPDDDLRRQLDEVLEMTFRHRHLNLRDNAAWQILHGVLAFQREFVVADRDNNRVLAVDYLLDGGQMNGWLIRRGNKDVSTGGHGMRAVLEPGTKTGQGHADQWLAVLAQCGLPVDQSIRTGGDTYSLGDWIHQVEWDVPTNTEREYSWTLIGLTTYRPTDHRWTASDGEVWSIERLIEIELEQDIDQSACGGTHRLIGLTMALDRHLADGGQLDGVWQRADQTIDDAIESAKRHRDLNDGSLSVHYFARPGTTPDTAEDLGATGHTLEFLALAMTDEQLQEEWVKRAVIHLCGLFRKTKDVPLDCGPLYHAAHGLVLYRQRVFGARSYATESAGNREASERAPEIGDEQGLSPAS